MIHSSKIEIRCAIQEKKIEKDCTVLFRVYSKLSISRIRK